MGVRDAEPAELSLRLGQSLLVIAGAVLAASIVVAPAEAFARALGAGPESAEFAVARTVGQFLGFLLASVLFLVGTNDTDLVPVRLPTKREVGVIAGSVVVLLAVQFLLIAAFEAAGIRVGTNDAITTGQNTPAYFLYMLPISVALVGPAEELLFRGIIQGELKRAIGPRGAIAVAGLAFGLIHFTVSGSLAQRTAYVVIAGLLGVGLGLIYEYSGNLTVPAVAHGLYNATLFGFQYLVVVGVV